MSGDPNRPATGLEDTVALKHASADGEGDPVRRIGPYRLLELIGEGGMGEVWLRRAAQPVRRQVALKVIKAGMDTKQVVARFESERQALALMDHPAIAKVFDGGGTPGGSPVLRHGVRVGPPPHRALRHSPAFHRERLELFHRGCARGPARSPEGGDPPGL